MKNELPLPGVILDMFDDRDEGISFDSTVIAVYFTMVAAARGRAQEIVVPCEAKNAYYSEVSQRE